MPGYRIHSTFRRVGKKSNFAFLYARSLETTRYVKLSINARIVSLKMTITQLCPIDWGCRIHRLLLCRGVRPHHTNECPVYDTIQSDRGVPVMPVPWGMRSSPSLPSLLGPFWLGVVALDMVLSMGQTELNRSFESLLFLHLNCIFMLNRIV